MAPPRGPETWGSPLRGRGGQRGRPRGVGTPSDGVPPARPDERSGGGGASPGRPGAQRITPRPRGARTAGTPDRWKLFGSHGQRPWLQDVVEEVAESAVRCMQV